MNGETTLYTFTLTTKVTIIAGEVYKITFPAQVTLPATVTELNITPIPRVINGILATDELKVEMSGQTVIITFITVATASETYEWTLDNISNPVSMVPADFFGTIIS